MESMHRFSRTLLAAAFCLLLTAVAAPAQILTDTRAPQPVVDPYAGAPGIAELNVDAYGLLDQPAPRVLVLREAPAPEHEALPIPEPVGKGLFVAAAILVFVMIKLRYRSRARSLYGGP